MNTVMIDTRQIVAGPNDRQTFRQSDLLALADSIKAHGLISPITVRPIEGSELFEIVAGERRYRACCLLGWTEIKAFVADLSDEEAAAVMLAENTGRVDLNPIEEAQAFRVRRDRFGWTVQQISAASGASETLILRRILLLELRPELQAMIASGNLPVGHGEAMASLDKNRQLIAVRSLRDASRMPPLSSFRQLVNQLRSEQDQEALFDLADGFNLRMQEPDRSVLRGKRAVPSVPTRGDLPAPETKSTDSAASVIERWIRQLSIGGFDSEAATVGTLYTALVRSNFLKMSMEG